MPIKMFGRLTGCDRNSEGHVDVEIVPIKRFDVPRRSVDDAHSRHCDSSCGTAHANFIEVHPVTLATVRPRTESRLASAAISGK